MYPKRQRLDSSGSSSKTSDRSQSIHIGLSGDADRFSDDESKDVTSSGDEKYEIDDVVQTLDEKDRNDFEIGNLDSPTEEDRPESDNELELDADPFSGIKKQKLTVRRLNVPKDESVSSIDQGRAWLKTLIMEANPYFKWEDIPDNLWDHTTYNDYRLSLCYHHSDNYQSMMAHVLEKLTNIRLQSSTVRILAFFFRQLPNELEIFSLISGNNSHDLIKDHTDYKFSSCIAKRLLDFHIIRLGSKNIGSGAQMVSSMRTFNDINYFPSLQEMVDTCRFRIRPDASIGRLYPFDTKRGIQVEVSRGGIRFNTDRIQFAKWPAILNHLSIIKRGQQTYLVEADSENEDPEDSDNENSDNEELDSMSQNDTDDEPQEEEKINPIVAPDAQMGTLEVDDSQHFEYLTYLQPIYQQEVVRKLEAGVLKDIREAIKSNTNFGFDLCHKLYNDYYQSPVIRVRYSRSPVVEFRSPPSRKDILSFLVKQPKIVEAASKSGESGLQALRAQLHKVKIKFQRGSKDITDPLLSYIEGARLSLDDDYCFRLSGGHWYKASQNFLDRADVLFVQALKDCLIYSNKRHPQHLEGQLKHKWSECKNNTNADESESSYNSLYYGEPGHLYGDEVFIQAQGCPKDIELWDILKIGQVYTWIYQVKINFTNSTRDACAQIRTASDIITEPGATAHLRNWLLKAQKRETPPHIDKLEAPRRKRRYDRMLNQHQGNLQQWIDRFDRSKLMFVLAFYKDSWTDDFFEEGLGRLSDLTIDSIDTWNLTHSRNGGKLSAEHILEVLKSEEYINSRHRPTQKLISCTQKDFVKNAKDDMGVTSETCKMIFKSVRNALTVTIDSLVAKLEIINLHTVLQAKGIKLRLLQIPK